MFRVSAATGRPFQIGIQYVNTSTARAPDAPYYLPMLDASMPGNTTVADISGWGLDLLSLPAFQCVAHAFCTLLCVYCVCMWAGTRCKQC